MHDWTWDRCSQICSRIMVNFGLHLHQDLHGHPHLQFQSLSSPLWSSDSVLCLSPIVRDFQCDRLGYWRLRRTGVCNWGSGKSRKLNSWVVQRAWKSALAATFDCALDTAARWVRNQWIGCKAILTMALGWTVHELHSFFHIFDHSDANLRNLRDCKNGRMQNKSKYGLWISESTNSYNFQNALPSKRL